MGKYLLFCINDYYPRGGVDDLEGFYDTAEEAKTVGDRKVNLSFCDWYQVVDAETLKEITYDPR